MGRIWLLAAFVLATAGSVFGGEKFIRLRNELIGTPEPAAKALAVVVNQPVVSGLYIVQFNDRFKPEWRAQLAGMGVDLLWYVPDDAFVARLQDCRLEQIRALVYVRWVGEYRPEHKILPELKTAGLAAKAGQNIAIKLLISPKARPAEFFLVRRKFSALERQSRTPFGMILEGSVAAGQLEELARSSAVLWIERSFRPRLYDEVSTKIVAGDDLEVGTRAVVQQLGFDGSGVTVAVADSGLNNGDAVTMHPDLYGRTPAFFYYGSLLDAADEHSHGTHVAGIIAGNAATGETDENGYLYGLGVAPGSSIVAQRMFDGVGNYEPPPTFETLTRDATRAGAVIGSNSWGDDTQGRYDLSAAEFDALVRDADALAVGDQPYILEFSAGNAGPALKTIGSPAVAKNVIATGACQSSRQDFFIYADGIDSMADFSSRGPCEDGRIKPDVVAPGTWIASLQSASATNENAWAPIDDYYQYEGGTSQAGPHASGAAAVFVQYYRSLFTNTPSPALVKAALINSAVDMDDTVETGPVPNADEGWGRIDLTKLIGGDRNYEFVDQTVLLTAGQSHEHRVLVRGAEQPLKVTLAYTDVPALPSALPALVNDLDLEVVAPDGTRYRGNQFDQGQSVPNPASFDRLNNVEGVFIAEPQPGEYVIRVTAYNVVEDARRDTGAVDQDYALVVSGALPIPGISIVWLDRRAYTAPATINVRVIDLQRAGQPSATVELRSGTEPAGETIVLQPSGNSGVFTGAIATASGPAAANGRLEISDGDVIEARYFDAVAGTNRVATARADLLPPVIGNVTVTNAFGQMVISWDTDEPATSTVRYGTNRSYALAETDGRLVTSHSIGLAGLRAGITNYFKVISTDEAGNTATNDNNGMGFALVPVGAPTVLLVDAYESDGEYPPIPVTTYTGPLDQIGVTYDVWNVSVRGSPTLANMSPYRVVIWRINDSFLLNTTLTLAQQNDIQSYLNGGGAFLMGSMEILSRIGATPFRSNVLQVQQFTPNTNPYGSCPTCDEDHGVPSITGRVGDFISGGMSVDLDYSAYPYIDLLDLGPDFSDTFTPTTNATTLFTDTGSGRVCGISYPRPGRDSAGRVVFLSFPFDAIPESGPAPNNRVSFLRNALEFLAPGLGGKGMVSLNAGRYTVPSQAIVEVGDSDLEGQGSLTVRVFSSTATNGLTLTLSETSRRGFFRGYFYLVGSNNLAGPMELRAANGDTVWVEYIDASLNAVARAQAVVDTVPPVISNVEATPDYDQATITFDISEEADGMVQFGETPSALGLNRTAYSPAFDFSQELKLTGLQPDKTYYFQVVSRDVAGNVVVDDNGGQFYSFRTLQPERLPWSDNMEQGAGPWSTFDGEDSQAHWTLGVPGPNCVEPKAFSPPNAWGCNLSGASIDTADTFLISPAIELSGGNRVTLRFWHSYDFTERTDLDLLEVGYLYLFTNQLADPIVLAEFGDMSGGWIEEEIDLSPYLGRVVYLVWHYQLLAFEAAPRPGWLIDDVSVTATNVVPGRIQVTNNISQAGFILTGPATLSGQGRFVEFTNAPPGTYVIRFADVPYYQTPDSQSNFVDSGQQIIFTGQYGMADANGNGVADSWEQQYFGELVQGNPAGRDSDGDGVSDLGEFLAGTNPTNAASVLKLNLPQPQTGGAMRLVWPTAPGRSYMVLGSTDLRIWRPLTEWTRASGSTLTVTLPTTNSAPLFLKLQAIP